MYNLNNLSGLNPNNTLAQYLSQYLPTQNQQVQEPIQTNYHSNSNYNGIKVYEIRKKEELTYVKPDLSGQKQIIFCEEDKTMYVTRYNYSTEKSDYEEYISKGTIELFKVQTNSEEMSQIANALVLVVEKLEHMQNGIENMKSELNEIKNTEPKIIEKEKIIEVIKEPESNRNANGTFKKKAGK